MNRKRIYGTLVATVLMLGAAPLPTQAQFLKKLGKTLVDAGKSIIDEGKNASKDATQKEKDVKNSAEKTAEPKATTQAEQKAARLTPEQEYLSKLTFRSYGKYVRPTKDDVNLRQVPSTTGAIAGTAQRYQMLPVVSENQGWYETTVGWVSKQVAKETKNDPITPEMMNTNIFGYIVDMDLGAGWRVYWPVGSLQMAVAECDGKLLLGRLIDNVFVFKYAINVFFQFDEENKRKFDVHKENYEGSIERTIYVGTDLCVVLPPVEGLNVTRWAFDLSKLNDKVLVALFKEVIDAGKTADYYIGSELLQGEFSNFFGF